MHQRRIDRFERLGQMMAHDVGIGFVGDDHEFAMDEPIRAGRIARPAGWHRRQFENVFLAHESLVPQWAVQPPSIGSRAPVIDAASSEQRNVGERGDLRHLDEFLGRLRRQQHVAHHRLFADAARLSLLGNLLLHQRGEYVAGADGVGGDAVLGEFERDGLGQSGEAVLGRHVGGLVRRGDQRVRRGDIDDAPPAVLFHVGDREPAGVKGARQIDRQDRIPFVDRKFLDRRDVLNAGIVDEDIDAAEFFARLLDHRLDLVRVGDIGVRNTARPHCACA